MKLRPEDAEPGHWWAKCCDQDIEQIESQADVDEMLSWANDEDMPFAGVWDTQESALADLTAKTGKATSQ